MTRPDSSIATLTRIPVAVGEVQTGGPTMSVTRLGTLTVTPGAIVLMIQKWLIHQPEDGLVLCQREGAVRIQRRLFPPWQNTLVWVKDDPHLALVTMSPRQGRTFRSAVTVAGFGIKESKAPVGGFYYET